MDYDAKINELEKVFGSYTIEDYYCDPEMKFLHPDFAKILEMKDLDFDFFFSKQVENLSKENSSKTGIYGDERYKKLKVIAKFLNSDLYVFEELLSNDQINIKGKIDLSRFNDINKYNKERITRDNGLQIPKNWKDIISQFIDSDIEKIGKYFYREIENKIYQNFASIFEGQQFTFENEGFNRFEMATIIAIKKALRSGNFFKNKNKVLLDLRNGLSCEIEFKEKGEIISQKVQGKNAVISSSIVSLSDDNGRRAIGRLNKFYYFFTKDFLIKIEFVETGILR
ncbi:hypothetical protein [Epilithonimonas hungarica]|uniref:Uncharacterized protein n=1 Tax=Epilithonimonas hungarica TaxID=454006 RepID=A0A1G7GPE7_9FLAO|nr:hypothetical protein [Epilithonimonas hungarica]SDE90020.1 hypothetical protein SAMN05421825_0533 [Epilithonimonas hungarica]